MEDGVLRAAIASRVTDPASGRSVAAEVRHPADRPLSNHLLRLYQLQLPSAHGQRHNTSYTRSPRAQAACMRVVYCICLPTEPTRVPRHSPARRTTSLYMYIVLYYGRPLSLGLHRHLRHPPRYGASRRSSTGLYGPVAAGTPASPRPRPSLYTPVHLNIIVSLCGALVCILSFLWLFSSY